MATKTPASKPAAPQHARPATRISTAVTQVSAENNRTFHARVVYRSGTQQEFTVLAQSTTAFDAMRTAYAKALSGTGPAYGTFAVPLNGTVVIDWREVASFYDWAE
ncbi:hypothetical protein [Ramlibacter humi]|uniref:Uncharacterized protein n=1 Tax=Ramlibacter humi TaxID=2530451 RepID=A0A4Z0C7F6_9BURK|nr:hypothetical protein [Ramlibacter humi]TFZ07597.1 hypothetical protein EZ216_00055 [Ramlibacter humi]